MIAELLPQLATMTKQDKLALYWELDEELKNDGFDVGETEEGKAALTELLEARLQHYREHPETASSWEEVQKRLQQRMHEWKSARQVQ